MAAIVYQTDKRTGITYAYESISYWDKDKKQSRAKRKLIGRVVAQTGEIVATRKKAIKPAINDITSTRYYCGATYLFDEIAKKIGLKDNLQQYFPKTYSQILSIAYYLILEDKNPLSRFAKWAAIHKHPFGKEISSQRSSELFASIDENSKNKFLLTHGKCKQDNEYWLYDTTSISSYSKCLKQVKYGNNKDHDNLAQINLAVLFGEQSALPFYYRKLPGNISDVSTIKNLLADMDFLKFDKIKIVFDRGFYSQSNIDELYKKNRIFLMSAKLNLKFIQQELEQIRPKISNYENYQLGFELYSKSKTINWSYKQSIKGKEVVKNKKMYLHIYYNGEKALADELSFNKRLHSLELELKTGKTKPENEQVYQKYFNVNNTASKGITVSAKQDAIELAKQNYGFFVLISNEIKDASVALTIYRNKDLVEKSFENLKDRLNFNRTAVSSEKSLDGKIFVEFIALIFLSFIKKQMHDNEMFKKYTIHELLDTIDLIECFEQKGREIRYSEITEKQKTIFTAMGVVIPSSLC